MTVMYYKRFNLEVDNRMQQLAWQTALIMNSSGNYKKQIKPSQLYQSVNDREKDGDKHSYKVIDRDIKNKEIDRLTKLLNM